MILNNVIPEIGLVTLLLVAIWLCYLHGFSRYGRLLILAPSSIWYLGCLARYGVGSVLLSIVPREFVPNGEFGQYIVSWKYSNQVAGIWMAYVMGSLISITLLRFISNRHGDTNGERLSEFRNRLRRVETFYRARLVAGKEALIAKRFEIFMIFGLLLFFVMNCIGIWTGSLDRGSGYNIWSGKVFTPISSFIAVARLKQVVFFLMPICIMKSTSRVKKMLAVGLLLGILSTSLLAGERGAALYPIVMVWLGYILASRSPRRVILTTMLVVGIMGVSIPYLAAYRESTVIEIKQKDLAGRAGGLLTNVSNERLAYRFRTIGREIYACSDSFLFIPERLARLEKGFGDINRESIGNVLLPRVLSRNKSFEKNDGSRIARLLMGVDNNSWFPCISTPGDLWRRGGNYALFVGGLAMGIVLFVLDRLWVAGLSQRREIFAILMPTLSVSYVQVGLYGTVWDIFWQLCWELPKYIVLLCLISAILSIGAKSLDSDGMSERE